MKLKKYSKLISKLAANHPDFEVIYSSDSEGNWFDTVDHEPSIVCYKDHEILEEGKENAVCIN